LRRSDALIGSIIRLLEIDLPIPDHSTLSRRACGLPVQSRPRSLELTRIMHRRLTDVAQVTDLA
jgi:hypothetical protein